jgi:predicted amidohydrolase
MNVRGTTVGERLDAGSVLSVLEAPIGNLAPLICLDLFNEALAGLIQESTADVFFVPSLSPKTSAHQHAAKRLRVTSLASTFVCNRKLDDNRSGDEDARSFYVVPGRGKDVQYHPDDSSFLLFAADGTSQDK